MKHPLTYGGSRVWNERKRSHVGWLALVAAVAACSRPGVENKPSGTIVPLNSATGAVAPKPTSGGGFMTGGGDVTGSTQSTPVPPTAIGSNGEPIPPPSGGQTPNPTGAPTTAPSSGAVVTPVACAADPSFVDGTAPGVTFDYASIEGKVTTALSQLSTNEALANQMGGILCQSASPSYWSCSNRNDQFSTPDDAGAGVRGFKFRDGPRGLSQWEDRNNGNRKATAFPVSIARAATFDLALEYQVGQAACIEALAAGWNNVLGPTVNLQKHPLAGRGQESYGEDPYWNGKMGTAFVVGCQKYAQACAKHYMANEVEDGRTSISATMDQQTLRENYARQFEMIIKDGDVACVMASYNKVEGTRMTENQALLKTLLRNKFGFRGFVVSDWAAMDGNTPSGQHDTIAAVNAGLEVEMPAALYFKELPALVGAGSVSQATLQNAVKNILTQKFRFGWGDMSNNSWAGTPTQNPDAANYYKKAEYLESTEHVDLARKVATQAAVLLKNDGDILPITPAKYGSLIVLAAPFPADKPGEGDSENRSGESFLYTWEKTAGNWADAARLGDKGSSEVFPSKTVSPFAGIDGRKPAGITVTKSTNAADAANADVAVVIAALTSFDEGEEWQNGGDREDLELHDGQAEFIAQALAANPNTVVVLEGGGPISHAGWGDAAKGIVMAWYPGMVGGEAIADLLYGTANFSGRLPQTWPKALLGEALDPSGSNVPSFEFKYLHGYRLFDKEAIEPLYPFGYGLSYTTFEYANASVPCSSVTRDGLVRLRVDVTNTGTVAGDEVVQVYIGYPNTAQRRPVKEFKSAVRVRRDPGQTGTVEIPLQVKDWAYFDVAQDNWVVEPVAHEIWVGRNSRDLVLAGTVPVTP
jgi:beta-glucosidase